MNFSRAFLLTLFTPLLISGCTPAPAPTTINPNQVYLGYPCAETCDDFKAGYEEARAQNLKDPSVCGDDPTPRATGCKAFVLDLKMLEDPTGGFTIVND
jgi:hypothetical protein